MRKLSLILVMTILLSSCTYSPHTNTEKLSVVTSFYPIMLITKAVIGNAEGVKITNLTKPQTGCLHDYTLMPEDIKTLEKADVFVINGLGMENFIEKVINTLPNLNVIDLSKGITPIDDNAHIWLAPENAAKMTENLTEAICNVNPQNSDTYKMNSKEYVNKLHQLNAEMKEGLKDLNSHDIVVFHEAFSYFANEYGLNIKATIQREPGEEPTVQELKETIDIVKACNVKALFAEPQYSSSSAETIAAETGAKVYQLDPIVTGENNAQPDEYFTKMRHNLEVLLGALK